MLEWSVMFIAIVMVLLTVCFMYLSISVNRSLKQSQAVMKQVKERIEEVGSEMTAVLQLANTLGQDVHNKMKALDPWFQSVEQIGESCTRLSSALLHISQSVSQSLTQYSEQTISTQQLFITDAVKYTYAGLELWNKWKSVKDKK